MFSLLFLKNVALPTVLMLHAGIWGQPFLDSMLFPGSSPSLEIVPPKLVYDEVGDDFVMVNGLKLTMESSRKVMKDACKFLAIPLSGSKAVVFKRLQVAVEETAAKAALDAARNEKRAMERRPQQAVVPRGEATTFAYTPSLCRVV